MPRLVNNYEGVIKTKIKRVYDVTYTNSMEFNYKKSKSTMNDDYGSKDAVCSRKPTQRCYKTPHKNQVEVCKTDVHRYCEKFSNIFSFLVKEQNCHLEPKKNCKFEMKTHPKKNKNYSYTKDGKEQPREVCDQGERRPAGTKRSRSGENVCALR